MHRGGACLGGGFQEGDRAARRRAGVRGPRPDIPVSTEAGLLALPGLVSAHFDIPQLAQTEGDILGRVTTRLNSGIAVVTPAHFVGNLIHSEPVAEELQDRERVSLPESAPRRKTLCRETDSLGLGH
jgi:hypothetical protein